MSVITYDWFEKQDGPVASMRTPRRCRDWNVVRDWMRRKSIQKQGPEITKPPGVAGLEPLPIPAGTL